VGEREEEMGRAEPLERVGEGGGGEKAGRRALAAPAAIVISTE